MKLSLNKLLIWAPSLLALVRADGRLSLTVFYPRSPSQEQIDSFSTGNFVDWPPSPYECGNDLIDSMAEASFSCASSTHPITPEGIRDYGTPMPPCTSLGIVFEHFHWGTWTHKCWAIPNPADESEQGHREVAFQSNALNTRETIMYQHDAHVFSINKVIEALYMDKERDNHQVVIQRDTKLANIDAWVTEQEAEADKLWFGGRWSMNLHTHHKADKLRKAARRESEEAILSTEKRFWENSYSRRMDIAKLDHLIAPYFELYMLGRTPECKDWAGYGVPVPEFPPDFAT